jgi:hypothetical protein
MVFIIFVRSYIYTAIYTSARPNPFTTTSEVRFYIGLNVRRPLAASTQRSSAVIKAPTLPLPNRRSAKLRAYARRQWACSPPIGYRTNPTQQSETRLPSCGRLTTDNHPALRDPIPAPGMTTFLSPHEYTTSGTGHVDDGSIFFTRPTS